MKLARNWGDILRRAWSIRLNALAIFFSGLEIAWPMLEGYLPIPQRTFAVLAGIFASSAMYARIVAQKNLPGE